MIKLSMIVLVTLGAVLYVPALRHRADPIIAPVKAKLAPVTTRFATPAKRWSAKNEASAILHKLSDYDTQKRELPDAMSFRSWVRTNTRSERKGLDPWGHAYYLVQETHQITVGSPGPDRRRNTPDDIRVSAPVQ